MELSPRGILTPLQSEFLERFFGHPNALFLSGGTALSEFYLGHRFSKDLDLFCVEDPAFAEGASLVERVSGEMGATLARVQTAPTFRRYALGREGKQIVVDLVLDAAYQAVPDKPLWKRIRVDSLRDITANKLCTVLSRLESRDYLDLYCLAKAGVSLDAALPDAERKDGGMSKPMLALLMGRFRAMGMPDSLREPFSREEVERFFKELSERWARESAPGQSNSP